MKPKSGAQLAANQRYVFINCPFDDPYGPLSDAIVFAVHDCGYIARSAKETDNAGHVRITKILEIIGECRLGIHDISRTDLDPNSHMPRFNMPFELGIFLGARHFGGQSHSMKNCLILEHTKFGYQRYLSDIAGQDTHAHSDDPTTAIDIVRNWLSSDTKRSIPGGEHIVQRYSTFCSELPLLCQVLKLDPAKLGYNDFVRNLVIPWLKRNP